MEEQRGAFRVDRLCRVMNVSPRGLRAYRSRPASRRQRTDMVVLAHIKEQSHQNPGTIERQVPQFRQVPEHQHVRIHVDCPAGIAGELRDAETALGKTGALPIPRVLGQRCREINHWNKFDPGLRMPPDGVLKHLDCGLLGTVGTNENLNYSIFAHCWFQKSTT